MSSEPRLAAPITAVSPIELTSLTSMPELETELDRFEVARFGLPVGLVERPSSCRPPPSGQSCRGRLSIFGSAPALSSSASSHRRRRRAPHTGTASIPVKSTHASVPVIRRNCCRIGGCSSIRAFGSAPLSSSNWISGSEWRTRDAVLEGGPLSMSMFRVSTAANSGVRPYQSTYFTSAPCSPGRARRPDGCW